MTSDPVNNYFAKCGCDKDAPLEVLKEKLLWGTYGPPHAQHPLKYVLLKDCSSEHLTNILLERLTFDMPLLPQISEVIEAILHERGMPIPSTWTMKRSTDSRFGSNPS